MDNNQTWIDPQPENSDPEMGGYDSLPPMPPAPEPPGSGQRRWQLRELIIGLVLLIVCIGGGFALWQSARRGFIPIGLVATITPNADRMTLTAEDSNSQLQELPTDIPVNEPTEEPTATDLPPTETEIPTDIPTETSVPTLAAPELTTSQALFCRVGPSSTYDIARALNAGETYPVIGQSISPVDGVSIWWQIDLGDRICFVSSTLGTIEGDVSNVTSVLPPPTVTPTPTEVPTSTPTPTPTTSP